MAERYDDRSGYQYRDRGPRPDERGFVDRASDEVRAWFGDDEAERRRQMDDRDRPRERPFGPSPSYANSGGRGYGDRAYGDRAYGDRAFERGYSDRGYIDRGYGYGGSGDRGFGFGERDYGSGYPSSAGTSEWPGRTASESMGDRDRGRYSGRGPKGYQRSDARINEDVCDRLCDAGDIDASQIEVRVENGEVTLNGSVSDRAEKRRAEDLIEHVSGVRDVCNNLRVNRNEDARRGLGAVDVLGLNTDTGGANQAASGSKARTAAAGAGAGGTEIRHPGITGGGPSGASNTDLTGR
jgi:osmotically-inducible protein OsmY